MPDGPMESGVIEKTVRWELARNARRVARLDIPGGGQVTIQGDYAYVGHMKPPHGTSIIDIRDPANPRVVAHVDPPPDSHTHKVRVVGDIMITNVEMDRRHFLRKGDRLPALRKELGVEATDAALAARLGVTPEDIPVLDEARARGYRNGGFRVWDVSDKANPRLLRYVATHGFGVHRFHMDADYAYISTEMPGYIGNILVTYALADPADPREVSRWHMAGQHLAGGETPTWPGYSHRLHHAMRCGNELWAAVWHAGFRVLDASDPANPKVLGGYRWPPAIPEPTHTVMPFEQLIDGRRYALAIDEEHDHKPGRLHGFVWVLDVTDLKNITAVTAWDLSERASPWVGEPGARFGAHQYYERLDTTRAYFTWFAGGLRVVDFADPLNPVEVAHYMPDPGDGTAPQSNDVALDDRGLVYVIDRVRGLDIVEITG
ncbi:MAG: RNA polymerase subunit sigma-70 [Pseudomonadota bacterium]